MLEGRKERSAERRKRMVWHVAKNFAEAEAWNRQLREGMTPRSARLRRWRSGSASSRSRAPNAKRRRWRRSPDRRSPANPRVRGYIFCVCRSSRVPCTVIGPIGFLPHLRVTGPTTVASGVRSLR